MDSLKFLLIGAFFVGVLCFCLMNQNGGKRYSFKTWLDAYIPFVPVFSLFYLALFPFIAFSGAVLFTHPVAVQYYAAMAFAMCSAVSIWFFFPSRMERPAVPGKNIFQKIVKKIYAGDAHANAFPSSHVFTSLITSLFLSGALPEVQFLIWTFGVLVAVSTVLIKQHFAVDVIVGIVWAYAGVGVAHIIFP